MYFGTVINSFDDLRNQKGKFYFSPRGLEEIEKEWWDEHKDDIVGHKVVGAAFTDYGGDELDRLVYDSAVKIEKDGGLAQTETTSWSGGNALIFGELADKMCEDQGDIYRLYGHLGDLDEDMGTLEHQFIGEEIDNVIKSDIEGLTDDEIDFVYDWLRDNARVLATGLDYSFERLEDAVNEFRSKKSGAEEGKTVESTDENNVECKDWATEAREVIRGLMGCCDESKAAPELLQKASDLLYMK